MSFIRKRNGDLHKSEKEIKFISLADSSKLPLSLAFLFLAIKVTLSLRASFPKPIPQMRNESLNWSKDSYPLWVWYIYVIRGIFS